jgi:hypothetical protein
MADEITKTELHAMIEVQTKSAQQMENIANSLNVIVEAQKDITKSLAGCTFCKDNIKSMAKDLMMLKWIWTSIAAVVGVGMIILEIIDKFHH